MPAMMDKTRVRRPFPAHECAGDSTTLGREATFAAQWAAGAWCGAHLRTEQGDCYTVRYQGRRGGAAGPDFRDAVLVRADGTPIYGDIELHLRAGDWRAHGHQRDPRYDGVVLHVVLHAGTATPGLPQRATLRANGAPIPTVVLAREGAHATASSATAQHASQPWPCAQLACQMGAAQLRAQLLAAGMARFEEHSARFVAQLHAGVERSVEAEASGWAAHDRLLWLALAEAEAYGRDRSALRAAAEQVLNSAAPDALLAETVRWPRIEGQRLAGLLTLYARWQATGPWLALAAALRQPNARAAGRALATQVQVAGGVVSPGRALIVVANIVLPFAGAWSEHTGDAALGAAARRVYVALAGLPSNQITRVMTRQLGLARLPQGAAAQQGLQQIWAETCREKRCDACRCVVALAQPYPGSAPDANCGT